MAEVTVTATTECLPFINYDEMQEHYNSKEELHEVKLRQDYDDGTYKEAYVVKATNAGGIIILAQETIPEYLRVTFKELNYDIQDVYTYFANVLGPNFKSTWADIERKRRVNHRTEETFKKDLFELIKQESGDPHFDQTMKLYLTHSLGHYTLRKPLLTSPKEHSSIVRALVNIYNNIPTVTPLTEAEVRLCHYHSYPNKWREIYRKSHEEVSDIHHLTASMQDLYNEEVSSRARKAARQHSKKRPHSRSHGRRSDNEDERESVSQSDVSSIEAEDASEYESHQHQHHRGQSRPKNGGRRNKYPRNSYSNGRGRSSYNYNKVTLDPEDPCPIHCIGMSKKDCSHTWYLCKLNPKGPNYTHGRMSHNDAHYNDTTRNDANNNEDYDHQSSHERNAAKYGHNDHHYLDMFGLDTVK